MIIDNVPDISKWQGEIDWKKINGPVIIRAGYRGESTGLLYKDEKFIENRNGVNERQLDYRLYFYSQATNIYERQEEAIELITSVAYFTIKPLFLRLDLETRKGVRNNKNDKDTWQRIRNTFADTIRKAGYIPFIYANESFWTENLKYSTEYGSWVRNWSQKPKIPYNIWQYTNKGKLPGINGNVDLNQMDYRPEEKNAEMLIEDIINKLYTLKEIVK